MEELKNFVLLANISRESHSATRQQIKIAKSKITLFKKKNKLYKNKQRDWNWEKNKNQFRIFWDWEVLKTKNKITMIYNSFKNLQTKE